MRKSALIIRNISQLSSDELGLILKLANLDKTIANSKGESGFLAQFKQSIQEEDNEGVRLLLKKPVVRDYLYNKILSNTGCHILLHEDETPVEKKYIVNKLNEIKQDTHMNLLYIGGGHGGYVGLTTVKLLSGLTMETVEEIASELKNKSITIDAAVLQSCSSALFVKFFRSFLTEQGVMLSYSAELGPSSDWEMSAQWILDSNKDGFFSSDAMAKPWEDGDLGTTTSIISTKSFNQLMDLDKSNRGLPNNVDQSDESTFQRELVMELFLQEKGIQSTIETDVEQFNEVIAMQQFNEHFNLALKERELGNNDSHSTYRSQTL